MTHQKTFIIIVIIFTLICSVPVWSLNSDIDTDSRQNNIIFIDSITVTSSTMDFNMKTSLLAFKGRVTVNNSQYTLKCNTLFITPDKNRTLESMQAEGNVRLKLKNGEITCQKATYSRLSGLFILEQNVTMQQEHGNVSADRITVVMRDGEFERIYCEGNVKSSLSPGEALPEITSVNTDDDEII